MALIPNPGPDKYGGVTVSDGRLRDRLHARRQRRGESFHFVGVQAAEARAFAALEDGVPAESVNALYPRLMAADARSDRGIRLRRVVQRHRDTARLSGDVARRWRTSKAPTSMAAESR